MHMALAGSTRQAVRTVCATVLVLSCLAAVPATAERALIRPRIANADNGHSFVWDAAQGQVLAEVSSISYRNGEWDRVSFMTGLRRRSPGLTPRLRVRFYLHLQTATAVRYAGNFVLKLQRNGKTVLVKRLHRDLTLRPEAGHRAAIVRFGIDPLSGSYDIIGKFVADRSR
jgi:hypothetical protein